MGVEWLVLEGSMMINEFDEHFSGKNVLFCPLGWGGSQELFKFRKLLMESSLDYVIRPLNQEDFTREIITSTKEIFDPEKIKNFRDPNTFGPGWANVLVIYDDGVTSGESLKAGYDWGVKNKSHFGVDEVYTMVRVDNVGVSHFSGIKNFITFNAPSNAGTYIPKDVAVVQGLEEKLGGFSRELRRFIFSVGPRTRGWLPFAFRSKSERISIMPFEPEARSYANLLHSYLQEFGYDVETVVPPNNPTGQFPMLITTDYDPKVIAMFRKKQKGIYIHAGKVKPNVFNVNSEDEGIADFLAKNYMHTIASLTTGDLSRSDVFGK